MKNTPSVFLQFRAALDNVQPHFLALPEQSSSLELSPRQTLKLLWADIKQKKKRIITGLTLLFIVTHQTPQGQTEPQSQVIQSEPQTEAQHAPAKMIVGNTYRVTMPDKSVHNTHYLGEVPTTSDLPKDPETNDEYWVTQVGNAFVYYGATVGWVDP